MTTWRDRFQKMSGKTRFVVCRMMLHLSGREVAPLLGSFNQIARQAMDSDGDLQVLGEGLVEVCQILLQNEIYWRSAANEGDVFWEEGEAGDYVSELFTDSAQRYLSGSILEEPAPEEETLTLPVTENLVVMVAIALEGESPELETDLADLSALKAALRATINLHYQERLRAIQVHFSPAQLGDELTDDQLLLNFPELIPL
ncbi:MAG: DUF1517 domain-containing protein [Oculatellaceae cyanobacterium Prado106]|jgi:hypothetical protein|nr:DUF1517 domain-containing protein [Oculatellaceae cyanobacterium Prado106]